MPLNYGEDGQPIRETEHLIPERQLMLEVAKLAISGMKDKDIATKLRISVLRINNWIKASPEYHEILDQLLDSSITEAKNILSQAATKAASTLVTLLDSPSETAKVKAAQEILNRVGLPAVEEQHITSTNRFQNMSDDGLLKYMAENMHLLKDLGGGSISIPVPPTPLAFPKTRKSEDDDIDGE